MPSRPRSGKQSRSAVTWLALGLAALAGCAPSADHEALDALHRHFPQHAERVLGAAGGTPLVAGAARGGFVPAPVASADPVAAAGAARAAGGGLAAAFPARGDGAVRLSLPDGFAVEVREVGLGAAGQLVRGAVAYRRGPGAASYWSATAAGYEEWLLARPAADGVVAS